MDKGAESKILHTSFSRMLHGDIIAKFLGLLS